VSGFDFSKAQPGAGPDVMPSHAAFDFSKAQPGSGPDVAAEAAKAAKAATPPPVAPTTKYAMGTKMPDGSTYNGHPAQDSILDAMGSVVNNPSIIEKFIASHNTPEIKAAEAAREGPQEDIGKGIGDAVFNKTNSPALSTAAYMLPHILQTVLGSAGGGELTRPGVGPAMAPPAAGELAAAPATPEGATMNAGFRTADSHPVAQGIAGDSGKQALTIHNQQIGTTIAKNEAGVTGDLGHESLAAGREGPASVYNRTANALGPTNTLPQPVLDAINSANLPAGGRMTQGSPDAAAKIAALKQQFAPGANYTGNEIVNEMRGMRQEGSTNVGSDDVSNQELGKYQLKVANILEDHIGATLPPNADVSPAQFSQARIAYAKNYAVQGATRGSDVDMGAMARLQQADPGMLTDGLKAIGDFASRNPDISGLASRIYQQPSYGADVGGVLGGKMRADSLLSPSMYSDLAGGSAKARSILTGSTADSLASANARFPPRDPNAFAPLDTTPKPPPGMTASTPSAPPTGSGPVPGSIPMGDMLAHGVEQPAPAPMTASAPTAPAAPQGLTMSPADRGVTTEPPVHGGVPDVGRDLGAVSDVARPQSGAPFAGSRLAPPTGPTDNSQLGDVMSALVPDATGGPRVLPSPSPTPGAGSLDLPTLPSNIAPELSLMPHQPRGVLPSNAQLGDVMSQGVPDGIVQRTPPVTGPHNQMQDAGTESPVRELPPGAPSMASVGNQPALPHGSQVTELPLGHPGVTVGGEPYAVMPNSRLLTSGDPKNPTSMAAMTKQDDGSYQLSSVHTDPAAQGQGLGQGHIADAAHLGASEGTRVDSDTTNSAQMIQTLEAAKRNGLVTFDIDHPEAYAKGLSSTAPSRPIRTPTPLVSNITPTDPSIGDAMAGPAPGG